jgi:hypothetical protein
MEAVCSSKTLVSTYNTTWCHNAEDHSLKHHCYANLNVIFRELRDIMYSTSSIWGSAAVIMKSFIFWDISPCSLVTVNYFQRTTWRYILEDRTLHLLLDYMAAHLRNKQSSLLWEPQIQHVIFSVQETACACHSANKEFTVMRWQPHLLEHQPCTQRLSWVNREPSPGATQQELGQGDWTIGAANCKQNKTPHIRLHSNVTTAYFTYLWNPHM